MSFLLIIFTAFILVIFFHLDFFFHIAISLILTSFVFFFIFYKFKKNFFGFLISYVIFICFLLFIHLFPLILNPGLINEPFILGIGPGKTVLYDKKILELTSMICLSCALGIGLSISIFSKLNRSSYINVYQTSDIQNININTLPIFFWFNFYIISIALFYGVTPPGGSIFNVRYAERLGGVFDFTDSAFLISHILIIITVVDSFLDQNYKRKVTKIFFCLFFLILFFYYTASGSREAYPLFFGLIVIYFLINFKKKFPTKKIIFALLILFFVGQILSYIRSDVTGKNFEETLQLIKDYLRLDFLLLGTWSSALATVLSVAHDYVDNIFKFKLGKDYYDLFLSIPPGFIADMIGYVRPINMYAGPAYEMRYGSGGTHITVIPYRNFGIFGVFIISSIWFYIVLILERFSFHKISVLRSSIIVIMISIFPMFLWYGEKMAINAVIIYFILSIPYRICLASKKKTN